MRLVRTLGIVAFGLLSALCRVAALPFLVVGGTADSLRLVLTSRNTLAKLRATGAGSITGDDAFDELCERRQRSQRPRR